eukprot:TRINITY_DN11666_c0_g1_i4.p1 TRINITY_DN11666_c0_g1~~TRINITY_DN11666_c0_g1_i4.p1  ORF type:complete len:123 (+),score=10.90 TRINITY_DN11666_c0_g1_i4:203-571(+)
MERGICPRVGLLGEPQAAVCTNIHYAHERSLGQAGVRVRFHSSKQCHTPDSDYVLGPARGFDGVFLAGGGSGHAFKMGPAIGEAMASLALGESPPFDLAQFSPDRPALAADQGGRHTNLVRK